jgi:hypothetical protein
MRTRTIAIAALVVLAPATVAAAPHRAGKPDLVVTAGDFARVTGAMKQLNWFFRGRQYDLTWMAKTKNAGSVAAAGSQTGVFVKLGNGTWTRLDSLPVPRVPAAHTVQGKDTFHKSFAPGAWKYGTYPIRICADVGKVVAETNEANNCRVLSFSAYLIPYSITGTVSGTGPYLNSFYPNVKTSWDSGTLIFNLFVSPRFGNDGVIDYPLCRVDCDPFLHFESTGTDSSCSYSGSGDYTGFREFDGISLSFGRGFANYHAQDFVDWPNFSYDVTVVCPGNTSTVDYSPNQCGAYWFNTGGTIPFSDPGLTNIGGSRQSTTECSDGVVMQWDFDTGDPAI